MRTVELATGLILRRDDGTEEAVKTASVRQAMEGDEIAALMALSPGLHPMAAVRLTEKMKLAARCKVGGEQLTLDTWAQLTAVDSARLREEANLLDMEG